MTMDFFTNRKIASTVVKQVPCSFAEPNEDGSVGSHYLIIMLKEDGSPAYVNCECVESNGQDAADGMLELQNEQTGATCFSTLQKVRDSFLGTNETVSHRNPFHGTRAASSSDQILRAVEKSVVESVKAKRNKRLKLNGIDLVTKKEPTTLGEKKARYLNSVADQVTRTYGMFRVSHVTGDTFILMSGYSTVATREDGVWEEARTPMDLSDIKRLHREGVHLDHGEPSWSYSNNPSLCVVCGKKYSRMDVHTRGKAHRNKFYELRDRVLKATSSEGLKVINQKGVKHFMPKTRKRRKKKEETWNTNHSDQ